MENIFLLTRGLEILFAITSFAALVMVIAQFIPHTHWVVRMFDFPVKQMAVVQIALSGVLLAFHFLAWIDFSLAWLAIANLPVLVMIYTIYPYTQFHRKDLADSTGTTGAPIKIMSANVLMYNRKYTPLLELVTKQQPDCLLLMETDIHWAIATEQLEQDYPYSIKYPMDNTYGLIFYSKFKLINPQIRFLLKPDVPSFRVQLQLPNGTQTWFYGVHPEPPSPTESETSEPRDIELLQLANEIRTLKEPVIFAGDFNDVAWSHTTRLFRRYSGLLDPRIGRGSFSTFHVDYPMLRWPLDHYFLSSHFTINQMKVLPSIHSDHFPIMIDLQLHPSEEHTVPVVDYADKLEVKNKLEASQDYPKSNS